MSETKVHQFEKDFVFRTGDDGYLKGQQVRVGEVLMLTHISAAFENIATTEYVELGYWNGHAYIPLDTDKPVQTSGYVHWDGTVYLREGQYCYAYFADVANGEKMKLRANGAWV